MRTTISRKGSALLMVLGMLAFMIVSAVGFSAYMRYSRLPSSYLRRNNSARLLAKAAVARAIDAVDRAIGNNPHPNVGGGNSNRWTDRVFTGSVGTNGTGFAAETVTPLCLEALAYVPPGLVNEARYYSRVVSSCNWHSFPFDIGRYSYLVLDVSDYFDVNRLMADTPRSSAASRRVSLSYLFENTDHTSLTGAEKEWDKFMENYRNYDPETLTVDFECKYPFISLADFNLALGAEGTVGGFKSPFYDYITSAAGSRAGFYDSKGIAEEENYRRMTFVTDGWFPAGRKDWDGSNTSGAQQGGENGNAEAAEKVRDLGDEKYQPFAAADLEDTGKPMAPGPIVNPQLGGDNEEWYDYLSGLGMAALFDYLDADRYPLSLAIPTCERVPMIVGVQPDFDSLTLGVTKEMEPAGNEVKPAGPASVSSRLVEKTVHYRLSLEGIDGRSGAVNTLVAFPFARPDPDDGEFSFDGRISFFFSNANLGLRTREKEDSLHLDDATVKSGFADGVVSIRLDQGSPFTPPDTIKAQADAVRSVTLNAVPGATLKAAFSGDNADLLKVVYQWTQTKPKQGGGDWSPSFAEIEQQAIAGDTSKIKEVSCSVPALDDAGVPDANLTDSAKLLERVKGNDGTKYRFNAAVWVRVLGGEDNRVVDMVPACLDDDKIQNETTVQLQLSILGKDLFCGDPFPLLRFNLGQEFSYSIASLEQLASKPQELTFQPAAAICSDPRFNYAPEHWFAFGGENEFKPETWVEACGAKGRDGDIFMATSDAGYMQSLAEIAFLPAFTDLSGENDSVISGNMQQMKEVDMSEIPANFGATIHQELMWHTYDIWGDHAAAFNKMPWSSEGTGYKVTPYSDSTNILMAVFANTPLDWRRASTNVVGKTDYASMSAKEFNSEFAINEYSSGAKVKWEDLVEIASAYHDSLHNGNVQDWKDAWNRLDWDFHPDAPREICGFEMDSQSDILWSADRKYLYGFWRDCFGVSQQLFLIFVRAEPMMTGSGVPGMIPPQMGARAVALVWRDPHTGRLPSLPHQTRILFYRQFD